MLTVTTSRRMGDERRRADDMGAYFASFWTRQADSSRCRQKLGNANEVVGGSGEDEEPFDQVATTMAGLAKAADGLHPPEGFFDAFALDRADAIPGMPGRARIDRRAAIGIVLRDMRRAAALAAAGDEGGGVIVLVATYGA